VLLSRLCEKNEESKAAGLLCKARALGYEAQESKPHHCSVVSQLIENIYLCLPALVPQAELAKTDQKELGQTETLLVINAHAADRKSQKPKA
jgi:hypothetical protein